MARKRRAVPDDPAEPVPGWRYTVIVVCTTDNGLYDVQVGSYETPEQRNVAYSRWRSEFLAGKLSNDVVDVLVGALQEDDR